MKKVNWLTISLLGGVILSLSLLWHAKLATTSTDENTLNLYTCGNYIPAEIIRQFTKETGITVNVTEYDNNETMFTKLRLFKKLDYDIVTPSAYYVEKMIRSKMLTPLDHQQLPNLKNISPELLNLSFDPHNQYSVPHMWGTTGIIINTKYIKAEEITSWRDLWNPRYKNQLMLLDDMRDVFSIALLALNYSVNESDPQHIQQAYNKLRELLPNIKIFNIDTIPNIYIDEDAIIGMAWSGDANLAKRENAALAYIYPQDGTSLWVENLVILHNAQHIRNAHRFINYLMRPDVAKYVVLTLGYSTANQETLKLLPPELLAQHADKPIAEVIKHAVLQRDLDDNIGRLYDKYWEYLKIGN